MAVQYPVGDPSFVSLRTGGYLYIDKTALIHHLVSKSGKYFFLSRPRRFGKSLLISTLEAYFQGKKELFQGLAIDQLEHDWVQYPVLHLDFALKGYRAPDSLANHLNATLELWEALYQCENYHDRDFDERFLQVIQAAYNITKRGVVVLIDEYDKPLLDPIDQEQLLEANRALLKSFYGVLKGMGDCLRFVFLTGTTRFSKVSIFSDLNNLDDISMDAAYASLCGITEQELLDNCQEGLQGLLETTRDLEPEVTYEQILQRLKARYDGYHFCPVRLREQDGIYNPFSLFSALGKGFLSDYWFITGTPSYLIYILQHSNLQLWDLTDREISLTQLADLSDPTLNPQALFYQAGYLTLAAPGQTPGFYRLRYPNEEVRLAFMDSLSRYYTPSDLGTSTFTINDFQKLLLQGDAEAFMARLRLLYLQGNYQIMGTLECYYHNTLLVLFLLMGLRVQAEYPTSNGRIDLVLWAPRFVYLFEFKVGHSARAALRQIEQKGYAEAIPDQHCTLFKIGVSFYRQGARGGKKGIKEFSIRSEVRP